MATHYPAGAVTSERFACFDPVLEAPRPFDPIMVLCGKSGWTPKHNFLLCVSLARKLSLMIWMIIFTSWLKDLCADDENPGLWDQWTEEVFYTLECGFHTSGVNGLDLLDVCGLMYCDSGPLQPVPCVVPRLCEEHTCTYTVLKHWTDLLAHGPVADWGGHWIVHQNIPEFYPPLHFSRHQANAQTYISPPPYLATQ